MINLELNDDRGKLSLYGKDNLVQSVKLLTTHELLLLSIHLPLTKKSYIALYKKKLIEVNQKWKNHKSVNIIFFIYVDFLSKSDNYYAGNFTKIFLGNIRFA